MAHEMEQKMFASRVSNPWWAVAGENYCYPNATNEELFEKSKLAEFKYNSEPIEVNGEVVPNEFIIFNSYFAGKPGYHHKGAHIRTCKGRCFCLTFQKPLKKYPALVKFWIVVLFKMDIRFFQP